MSAWLFTILRNLFRSEYRKRRREVEDAEGSYAESLTSLPDQSSHLEIVIAGCRDAASRCSAITASQCGFFRATARPRRWSRTGAGAASPDNADAAHRANRCTFPGAIGS
jgi:hypothetical protein